MRAEDILELLRKRPFVPLRLHLTDGRTFDIHHPDQVFLLRSRMEIGVEADAKTGIPDHAEPVALLHIVRVEDLPATAPSAMP